MSSTIKVNNIQNLAGDDSGFDLSTNDKIGMKIANSEVVTVDTTGVVFNENSADRDFRVESDGNTHGLFLEGSTGNVGIGTSSPSQQLHLSGSTPIIRITDTDTNAYGEISSSSSDGNLMFFADQGNTQANTTMRFSVDASERMRINHHGRMSINATDDTTASIANRVKINCNNEALFGLGIEAVRNTDGSGGILITNNETSGNFTMLSFKASDNDTVGSVVSNDSSTAYNTSSDYRLKENVSYDFDATTRLKKLKPARFNFKKDKDNTIDGFIAHEVSDIVPNAVNGTKDALETYTDDNGKEQTRPVYQGIDQSKLVPLLTKALQELEARIAALEGK